MRKPMSVRRGLQLLGWSCGIFFFVWAYVDPRFRDAEGLLAGTFCLLIAVGVALMILGCAVTGPFRKTAFWFGLALVGQAVALQMIDAGQLIHYQHYIPLNRLLTETHPALMIYLAMQAVLVMAGIRARWPHIQAWIGRVFKPWQLFGVGLIFLLSSATVSRDIPMYIAELFFATFVQAVNLGNIVLMVWTLPAEALPALKKRFASLFGQPGRGDVGESSGADGFAVLAALWVTVLAAVLGLISYQQHPHIPDEVGYLYHARYFAEWHAHNAHPAGPGGIRRRPHAL